MAHPALLWKALALAGAMAAVSGFGAPRRAPAPAAAEPPSRLSNFGAIDLGPEVAAFYRDRRFEPLWVEGAALKPAAHRLLREIEQEDGVPRDLAVAATAARSGDRRALARA